MPENLMCPEHKSNSDAYRDGWDRIWEKWQAEQLDNDFYEAFTDKPRNIIYGIDLAEG